MPVILTTQAEVETWLTAPAPDALALQRPLCDGALKIVARGDRTGDGLAGGQKSSPTPSTVLSTSAGSVTVVARLRLETISGIRSSAAEASFPSRMTYQ